MLQQRLRQVPRSHPGCLGQAAPQHTMLCTCTALNQPHEFSLMHRPTACVLPDISTYQSKMQRIHRAHAAHLMVLPGGTRLTSTMHLLCICLENLEQKYGSPRGEFAANVLLKPTWSILGVFPPIVMGHINRLVPA